MNSFILSPHCQSPELDLPLCKKVCHLADQSLASWPSSSSPCGWCMFGVILRADTHFTLARRQISQTAFITYGCLTVCVFVCVCEKPWGHRRRSLWPLLTASEDASPLLVKRWTAPSLPLKKTKQKCTVKDKTEHFLSNQIHVYLSSVERGLTAAPATTSVSSFKRSKLCRRSTPVHLKRFLRAVLNFCLLVSVLHRGKINSRQALEPRGGSCF